MKKFIVSFEHKGFLFTAKVFIHKYGNAIVYSTKIVEEGLGYMFENCELIFVKEQTGYKMMLYTGVTRREQQKFEFLDWHIKTEFIDQAASMHKNSFSMS